MLRNLSGTTRGSKYVTTITCGGSFPIAPNSARVGIGSWDFATSLKHCQLAWLDNYDINGTHEFRATKVATFISVDTVVVL